MKQEQYNLTLLSGDNAPRYFYGKATEKARIKNITVNGHRATVVFAEYEAPEDLKQIIKEEDGTSGHYFYITFYVWQGHKSYWTDKPVSIAYEYQTTKEEGNKIYKYIKAHNTFTIDEP